MRLTRKIIIGIALLVLIAGSGFVVFNSPANPVQAQQADSQGGQREISVSGTGKVDAQPDMAVVSLGVQTDAKNAKDAMTENATKMQSVIDAVKQSGVDAKDIQTQSIQLQPRYQNQTTAGASPQLVGFTATNIVQVTVRQLNNLGSVLDAAVQAGSNNINGIQFEISNPTTYVDQAREAAMQDALDKAKKLSQLAGVSLGDVFSITETSASPVPFVQGAVMEAARAASVPVQPGTQTVQVQVNVTWLLK
jgi:uncharacterized protein YggE